MKTPVRWGKAKGLGQHLCHARPLSGRTGSHACSVTGRKSLEHALDAVDLGVSYCDHLLELLKAARAFLQRVANILSALIDARMNVANLFIEGAND